MSASNWAVCPRCKAAAQAAKDAALREASESYGKVPPEEWQELTAAAGAPIVLRPTFREDYEIYGAETGTVVVTYGGSCEVCGAAVAFTHEHRIEGAA